MIVAEGAAGTPVELLPQLGPGSGLGPGSRVKFRGRVRARAGARARVRARARARARARVRARALLLPTTLLPRLQAAQVHGAAPAQERRAAVRLQ